MKDIFTEGVLGFIKGFGLMFLSWCIIVGIAEGIQMLIEWVQGW